MKYLLFLMIYYNGPRVDVISTELYFDTVHECSVYKLTEEFQNKLRKDWRDFEKWKKEYPKCKAFFLEGRLFHVGESCNIN